MAPAAAAAAAVSPGLLPPPWPLESSWSLEFECGGCDGGGGCSRGLIRSDSSHSLFSGSARSKSPKHRAMSSRRVNG